jgi:HK97 family phage prohead protease
MKELRITELRAVDPAGDNGLILDGMPVVFDKLTTIKDKLGEYKEIIRAGALDGADLSDARLLYNHDLSKLPLARTPKTMQFDVNPAGMKMTAHLPDTEEGRSVHTAVKRGDLSGMSFAFKIAPGGSSYDAKTNIRTIIKIAKVYECSICPFPAYAETSVEARAQMQEEVDKLKAPERVAAKIKVNQILKRTV